MKKNILVFIIAISFMSCDDFLDLKPKNVRGVETLEDIRSLLGAHLKFLSDPTTTTSLGEGYISPWNQYIYQYTSCYSGQLMYKYLTDWNTGELTEFGKQYLNWEYSGTASTWNFLYLGIGPLNLIIDKAEEYHNEDPKIADYIIGEAKFWRAFQYFRLLEYYSPYKIKSEGVPVYLKGHVDPVNAKLPKNSQTEVYEQILGDLNDVLSLLDETSADLSYNIAFYPNIINGLLARVYQYKAESGAGEATDWENAKMHAEVAINNRTLYSSANKIKEMFDSQDISYSGAECDLRLATDIYILDFYGSYPDFNTEQEIFDLHLEGDIRKEAYFDEAYDWDTGGMVAVADKFSSKGWDTYRFPVAPFRLAELKLIKAEAQAKLNDLGGAIQTINDFRDARYPTGHNPVAGGQNQVLDSIMLERKREFVFEFGYWWFDMKRTQTEMTRTFETVVDDNPVIHEFKLEGDDFRYTFPLPDSEIELNFDIEQDPRWAAIIGE